MTIQVSREIAAKVLKTPDEYAVAYIRSIGGPSWFDQFTGPEDESLYILVKEWLGFQPEVEACCPKDEDDDEIVAVPDELVQAVMNAIFENLDQWEPL
jgi:hypothetical protein